MLRRCSWCENDQLYQDYHDQEWGVPCWDDGKLFEFLILEGAQAGLSWITILRKRENYQHAFDNFDAEKIARYGQKKIAALLYDKGIVRNRLKIAAAITNAQCFINIIEKHTSFADYLWGFVDGRPIQNRWSTLDDVPVNTPVSDAMSRELKKRGFNFVGTTICYAFMQAVGMVNDHLTTCFRHQEIMKISRQT